MRVAVAATLVGAVLAGLPEHAQTSVQLKSRTIDTGGAMAPGLAAPRVKPRSRHTAQQRRVHRIIQFAAAPDHALVAALQGRGVRVLQYVHENALLVSTPEPAAADMLGARWVGELQASDKISKLVRGIGGLRWGVVEFHADIASDEMRSVMLQAGLTWRDNPDLSPHQALTLLDDEGIAKLAVRDEVEYIFPASDALIRGRPTIACDSALTPEGRAGQFIARIGDGWDGPGKGAAEILYWFGKLTPQLPAGSIESEIGRALGEWARYAKLTFTPASRADQARTINILWAHGDHGDGFPFDGPSGALAHTFYPAPPNSEPVAGDMHFDDDESWNLGADIDVYSVALHEIGHALGLGHSDQPGAVMYPYYRRATQLTEDDIAALLDLYAIRTAGEEPPDVPTTPWSPPPEPPANPGAPTTPSKPSTPTDPGNPATPGDPVHPPASPSSDTTAPSITITAPGTSIISTNAASITVRGTASDNVGVAAVTWETAAGASGPAAGRTDWTAAGIPLLEGYNTITIRALDASGNAGWRVISVTRR